MINNIFRDNNIKATNQRKFVLDVVKKLDSAATLKNICDKCFHKMDNSTVYRILELFIEKQIFEKNLNYDNEVYYSLKEEHGHYFTCIKCHKKEKIEICPVDEIEHTLENNKGYKVLNHVVQLNGICNKCQKRSDKNE